jgi:hypothetical protein
VDLYSRPVRMSRNTKKTGHPRPRRCDCPHLKRSRNCILGRRRWT